MNNEFLTQVRLNIQQAERIAVLSHIRPDGDAVGSLLGFGLGLEQTGKIVQMVLADGLPESLRFLTGFDKITRQLNEAYDLLVVVDCSEFDRVGSVLPAGIIPDINIDHHITNTNFGKINLVEPEAAATAEIIAKYLPEFGLEWNQAVAEALLAGMIADTIGFRTNSVRSETLRQAADLMDRGADLPELYKKALNQRSLNALRYWGAGLSSLQREGTLVWTELTLKDRQQADYPGRDDADLINLLSAVKGVDIALVFVEQSGGSVKISWRAQNGYDVSQVAVNFGGGGHRGAAGAEVKGDLAGVKTQALEETRLLLKKG
jgi:phosphoesterase RecJ-like protein